MRSILPFFFLLPQIIPFYAFFKPNWSSYRYAFLPFKLHAWIKYWKTYADIEMQFSIYHLTQMSMYFCLFVCDRKVPINSFYKEDHSVMFNSWQTHEPTRLPCPWNSPGRNTGVGCHFLLQGIFLTQEWNPGLPHCKQSLYHLSHKGSPIKQVRCWWTPSAFVCLGNSLFLLCSEWQFCWIEYSLMTIFIFQHFENVIPVPPGQQSFCWEICLLLKGFFFFF